MKQFLISFCNNQKFIPADQHSGFLARLTLDGDQVSLDPLTLEYPSHGDIMGATGITSTVDRHFVVLQSRFSQLLELDSRLQVIACHSLEPLKGVHSLIPRADQLICVATKQDRIMAYDPVNRKMGEVFDLGTGQDTRHYNSICLHHQRLITSCFGEHDKDFWLYAHNGKAVDVETGETVIGDLKQPHSLRSFNDQLFVCDSSRKRVINDRHEVFFQADSGYIRGLYVDHELMLIGHSKGRQVSSSKGQYIGHIADQGTLSGTCGITISRAGEEHFIDLSGIAEEVYDIHLIA